MSEKEKWTKNNITSLEGKTIIVTGGNSGLGYESVKAFVENGADVIMTCRNIEKGKKAKEKLLHTCKDAKITVMFLDLMDLNSVRNFASDFLKHNDQLHILLNNAGILGVPYKLTIDGIESQQATNYFGHFALTGLLSEVLYATPGSRVVNVSSLAHRMGNMNFNNLFYNKGNGYSPMKAYSRSKLENLLFTFELQRYFKKNNYPTIALAAHPGVSGTNIFNHIGGVIFVKTLRPVFNRLFQSPLKGALPQIRASVDPLADSGEYYGPNGKGEFRGYPVKVKTSDLARNEETAAKLWKLSEEITGVKFK